ncbi:DUF4190 domain-containing protein [Streptomyces bathyalis]|uniref:DUF4190 domain-containing protein n=1 Tax=Streptomyces bathyalis TaxID=2710756 RepID=A0A7T1T4M8_9ACTN|nr:DUF4190 domain-containing protein [Streptomyces bathyalis]QPP06300.1 DUF4190 domain-containing protein [Streptomyces bathyalis]
MDQSEEDRRRRSVAEQPTITSGSGGAPPPVPPAPGAPGGVPGGGAGAGYGASPYGSPPPYGQQGHQQYGKGGTAYGYPAPGPQPYGYGAGPGPAGFGWHGPPPSNGKSVAAMVVGIIGLVAVSTCWGSFLGIILGPVALGLGLSAKRAVDRGELGGRGQAVAGFVMGIVGTVLSVICVGFLLVVVVFYGEELEDSGPGSGGSGSSLDARGSAAVLVLSGAADRDASGTHGMQIP